MAARYVMDQMKQIGLQPAGDKGGYFQHVPLVADRPRDEGKLTLTDETGKVIPLVFGQDYLVGGDVLRPNLEMQAPLVFVGYGLVAPEHGRDDYAGLDVKGKIVVALSGAPKFLQSEERAYYRSARVKQAAALAHGAVGFVSVGTLTGERLYFVPDIQQMPSEATAFFADFLFSDLDEVGRRQDLLIDRDEITVQKDDPPDLIFRQSGKLRDVSGGIARCGRIVDRQKDRFHCPWF